MNQPRFADHKNLDVNRLTSLVNFNFSNGFLTLYKQNSLPV